MDEITTGGLFVVNRKCLCQEAFQFDTPVRARSGRRPLAMMSLIRFQIPEVFSIFAISISVQRLMSQLTDGVLTAAAPESSSSSQISTNRNC